MKKINFIIGSLLVVLGTIIGALCFMIGDKVFNSSNSIDNMNSTVITSEESYEIINYLIEIIENESYYYEDKSILIEGALRGIVESLGDPYSVYFSEEEFLEFSNQLNAEIYGIGVSMIQNGPYPIIIKVVENSPAYRAGLKMGDTIKLIDGIDIKDKSLDEISSLIKGNEGTLREVGIYRDSPDNILYYDVEIDKINLGTISYDFEIINDSILGYIKIDSFSSSTLTELYEVMEILNGIKIDNLIIDVRNNPGGYVHSVKDVLDYFINTDIPFMYSQTNSGTETKYYLNKIDQEINYDIVVLINENSASAAEIFAAAMNEIGNYDLIGSKTFGKGTMQIIQPISDSSLLKITTQRWLTSNKIWIDKEGITPTISVEKTVNDLYFIDAYNDIKFDEVNDDVKYVQLLLKELDYEVRTDGYFDKNTEDAVKNYQLYNGIPNSGIVDFETAYSFNKLLINMLYDLEYDNQYLTARNYFLN